MQNNPFLVLPSNIVATGCQHFGCLYIFSRTCPRMHPCRRFCFQECARCNVPVERVLACGHQKALPCFMEEKDYKCEVEVEDVSLLCNHQVRRKCHEKAEDVACQFDCEDRLECGHACTLKCHKKDDPDHLEVTIIL